MGLTAVATRSPRPLSTCLMMPSMSVARFAAWRTRRSVKGFGPLRAAWSSCKNAVRKNGRARGPRLPRLVDDVDLIGRHRLDDVHAARDQLGNLGGLLGDDADSHGP